jgi:hypothetical protein
MYLLDSRVKLMNYIHILNCWWNFIFLLIIHLSDNMAQVFPWTSFGKTGNNMTNLKTSNRPNMFSHKLYTLFLNAFWAMSAQMFCFDCYKSYWYFSFDLISHSNHNCLGNHFMFHENFFHLTCRKSMPSSIYNVILPCHYMEITLLIKISWISRVIVSR